ncbi:hypothetical protein Bca52824_034202 [Brassica carinata]|uniref:Uncharacterized protein n=1 Tax=Brassica carinata TaxID=52824 RepID=A0A8X7V969_BRACI|nr:hypothetical protein Bca52824_034202 [Brassica carinata]
MTRYVKYLTKKYLKKHSGRDWLRVIAAYKDRYLYELRRASASANQPDRCVEAFPSSWWRSGGSVSVTVDSFSSWRVETIDTNPRHPPRWTFDDALSSCGG